MQIDLSNVRFSYAPSKSKIKNDIFDLFVDGLHISAPEFICLVGHTGSGKSTLAQILNCLFPITKGTLSIDGVEVGKRTKLTPIRKRVGLVFQFPEYQLFEDTVLKDVAFGPKNFGLDDAEKRAANTLKELKILELADATPFALSGGQMRKIAIAGILASDPDILILDEPTAGLDSRAKNELLVLLKELVSKGKTIIMITHDMDIVDENADRVLVMKKGHLVFDGSPSILFSDEERLEEYNLALPTIRSLLIGINKELGTKYSTEAKNAIEAISILGGKHE